MITQGADTGLYERGAATLVASWAVDAAGADGAEIVVEPGAAIAVFPDGPERDVFNNALRVDLDEYLHPFRKGPR